MMVPNFNQPRRKVDTLSTTPFHFNIFGTIIQKQNASTILSWTNYIENVPTLLVHGFSYFYKGHHEATQNVMM